MGEDPYSALAEPYVEHCGSLRGLVRTHLVHRQVTAHLPCAPALIADIGGGAGHQAIPLARDGHRVDLLDPSAEMLRRAEHALGQEPIEVAERVRLVKGVGEAAPGILGEGRYDAVLCHGVLMYLEDPAPLVRALVSLAKRGSGAVSVLAKNAEALALRPALQGRWGDALDALDSDRDVGNLGVVTRGDTVERLRALLAEAGAPLFAWYGVRILTDHLTAVLSSDDLPQVLEAEWRVSGREPYRGVSRLLHVIGLTVERG